ncbi:MAG TPA: hypothetical protein VFU26_14225 [Gaiellaceae bacterium]|nr:hypothetical protein [Gaiellaceae bacterium]
MSTAPGRISDRSAWRQRWSAPPRAIHSSETRPFFVTSEFLAYALFLMGLAITAATSPSVDAQFFWRYTAFATIAYMISRGLAKSGTRSRSHDPREDLDFTKDDRRD